MRRRHVRLDIAFPSIELHKKSPKQLQVVAVAVLRMVLHLDDVRMLQKIPMRRVKVVAGSDTSFCPTILFCACPNRFQLANCAIQSSPFVYSADIIGLYRVQALPA